MSWKFLKAKANFIKSRKNYLKMLVKESVFNKTVDF